MNTMLNDTREIESIHWDDADESSLTAGTFGTTKIIAYGEPGLHCDIPYLAIYNGDEIWQRIPAAKVRIMYKIQAQAA